MENRVINKATSDKISFITYIYHGSYTFIEEIDLSKAIFGLDEQTATDKFFTSEVFAKLDNKENKFYEKDWTEIYKLLLNELKLQK